MVIITLALAALALVWSLIAAHWFVPELMHELIENYDVSDIIFSCIIAMMAIALLVQEKRLKRIRQ
ncbi:MAG: hypothetical protein P8P30_10500 [Rickettsiales bacterium]|nr:hypothetical protein [Rickettsiales bacterium]